MRDLIATISLVLVFAGTTVAQLPSRNDVTSTPVPDVGHDYIHAPVETVNPANGSLSIRIGMPIPPSRGFTLPFHFAYDSNGLFYIYSKTGSGTYLGWATTHAVLGTGGATLSQGGWSFSSPMLSVQKTLFYELNDQQQYVTCDALTDYVFQDAAGNRHNLGLSYFGGTGGQNSACNSAQDEERVTTAGEGPILATTSSTWTGSVNAVTVTDADGTVYQFPSHFPQPEAGICSGGCQPATWLPSTITDRNGNRLLITTGSNGSFPVTYTDTIGRTALNISGLLSVGVSGSSSYQVNWTPVTPNYAVNMNYIGGQRMCTLQGSQQNISAVSAIVLPNGQQYSFQYDPAYGTVSKITYPTGGYVRYVWTLNPLAEYGQWPATTPEDPNGRCNYQYDTPAILHRYVSYDGTNEVLQQDFSYSTTWYQSDNSLWQYKNTTVTTHDLVRGAVYNTLYNYVSVAADQQPNTPDHEVQIPVEHTVTYKDPSGNVLRTVSKSWQNERVLTQQQTTLENNQVAESDWRYDQTPGPSSGELTEQVIEKDEYDYGSGSGSRGALLRKTLTSYVWDYPSPPGWPNQLALVAAHILDKPATVQVLNGAGVVAAGVSHQYDPKANLLQYQQWLNPTGTQYLTTGHSYDGYGNALSTTDPANNTTNYSYADNYRVTCPGVSSSNAFLTTITYPSTGVAHTESFTYDCPTGKLASSTDENGKTTSYQYSDLLNRLTNISYPDGGSTSYGYTDPPPNPSVTETTTITTSPLLQKVHTSLLDGFGREIQAQLTSDPEGVDKTDTSYDGLGRKALVSNPYRGASTDGTTQYSYDVLDRPSSVVEQDGSTIGYSYSGNTVTTTDEAGKKRTTQMDGLGRLTSVTEDPNGLNYQTLYQYDALDNLLCVEQHGGQSSTGCAADPSQDATSAWRVRRFTYDQLSRLLSAKNPENGTTSYVYDAASNLISKTDARPTTITYTPDALNRIIQKSYSDGEPTIHYCYDNQQTACGTTSVSNGIGRRTGMLDVSGSTAWSYDVMGRPSAITKSVGGVSTPTNYVYNLDGSLWQLVYPGYSFDTITYQYSAAGRPIVANYYDPWLFWSFNYVKAATYTASGALASYQSDPGGGSSPTVTNSYNNRLQPLTMSATTSQGTVLSLTYNFSLGTGDNGNVFGITNNLDSNRSQTFSYDSLNRLNTAGTVSTTCTYCWGNSYSIDAWGNLLLKTVTAGSAETWSQPADGKNHISAWGYDPVGNQNSVSGHVYNLYNAENQWTSQSTYHVNYVYDGDGRKVKDWGGASGQRIYVHDTAGHAIMEFDQNGTTLNEYLYFGDSRIARVSTEGGPVYYYYGDHLGTARVITDVDGNKCYDADYFPWGMEQHVYIPNCPQNYKFTGKERDPDTGSDYFGARWYRYDMSRFFSPDWSSTPTGVPYAKLDNPQSLNLYTYVLNNPATNIDADGHGWWSFLAWPFDSSAKSKPMPAQNQSQTQTQQNQQSPQRGLTVGVGVAGNADVGVVKAGAETNATVVATASISSSGKPSVGVAASGAAVAYAGDHVAAAPKQETKPLVAGAYAGGGVTFIVANTANSKGLSGPFQTISGNVGGGQGASVALSFDHSGTFVLQLTLGPGLGVSGWAVTTNTKAGCAGCE